MVPTEHTEFVLKELKRIIPSTALFSSLELIINPKAFESEYKKMQHQTDQYFSHLSVASPKEINRLTVEMDGFDTTEILRLIAAKLILSIQEFSYLANDVALASIFRLERTEWLNYFYHNQGNLLKRFS
jgi:hypothetical protein